MTAHPRSFVETAHGRLAYCRAGSGPPVVLIHGSLVTADDMVLALMQSLSRQFDVVAFDRPGHGSSEQTATDAGSPYAQAEMIAAGWSALGIERPIVLGHSFGGAVGLGLAIAMPGAVRGLIALAPICFPELRLEQLLLGPRAAPMAGKILARTQGRLADVVTLPLLRNTMFLPQLMPRVYAETFPFAWASTPRMMVANAEDSLGIWRALLRSAASYRGCHVPTHIIGGTHDLVVMNAKHGYAAASMMPNAHFEWLYGCGHMAHHFHLDMIARALSDMQASTGLRCEQGGQTKGCACIPR